MKEIFEMPEGRTEPGRVIHTLGYPFKRDGVGGTWMYHMGGNLISIGLVMPLDIKDPYADQHNLFQEFKAHPFVKGYLDGGKPVQYGAKVISPFLVITPLPNYLIKGLNVLHEPLLTYIC